MTDPSPALRVHIIGTGLVGSSAGLALRAAGAEVLLSDRDPNQARLAAQLGAGRVAQAGERADLALLAVPPRALPGALMQAQRRDLADTYSDVTSIQTEPRAEAEAQGCRVDRFVGGHPMAGRERSGPFAAHPDLFRGRPWVLCADARTEPDAVALVERMVRCCGAEPVRLSAEQHDSAVALVSHAPQALASALASELLAAPAEAIALAGAGLRDMTRIAASDPRLWTDILTGNADELAAVLDRLAARLAGLAETLRDGPRPAAAEAVTELVTAGNAGVRRLPGKHRGPREEFVVVPVAVPDTPGQLAAILAEAAGAGLNVEDLALEHAPGQPLGIAELYVVPEQADRLAEVLRRAGWTVHA
jgi:prephenate dehydrogenase